MADARDLGAAGLKELGFPQEITEVLQEIQNEVADAYREGFIEMVGAMKQQASALNRIQATLNILIEHVAPQLEGKVPVAIGVAESDASADVAKAVVVADPIGSGYVLSQSALAQAIGVPATDVSILVRAFKLKDDGQCAVVVRKGLKSEMVNYHPRAVKRFLEGVANPPRNLSSPQESAIRRVRKRLVLEKAIGKSATRK